MALAVLEDQRYRAYRTLDALPLYEELIVTGAWWDYVDAVGRRAARRAAAATSPPVLREWSVDADLWKRRASIIAPGPPQGGDRLRAALRSCIEPNRARPRVLHPQGDRLGAAFLRLGRPGGGGRVLRDTRAVPPFPARGAQAHCREMTGVSPAPNGFVLTLVTGILAVTFLPLGIVFTILGAVDPTCRSRSGSRLLAVGVADRWVRAVLVRLRPRPHAARGGRTGVPRERAGRRGQAQLELADRRPPPAQADRRAGRRPAHAQPARPVTRRLQARRDDRRHLRARRPRRTSCRS